MAARNEYHGYVKLPSKELYHENIRFDFNPHIRSNPEDTRLEGFTMRMFVLKDSSKDEQPEMSVTMTTEQWLDLMDSMKNEFDQAQEIREKFDNGFDE